MSTRTPTLAEVMRTALDARLGDVHTCLPAKVVRYDATKCVVDAAPLIRAPVVLEDGSTRYDALPVVPNVPVAFPGAGAFRVTFPVAIGDTVLLVFSEASLERWAQFGTEVDPEDPRRFTLSDAFAIPGVKAPAQASAAATDAVVIESTADVRLGNKTAAEALALATRVNAELDTIRTAFNLHVHSGVTTGPGLSGTPATPFVGPSGSTASARVKADS